MRKMNGQIRCCINCRERNKACPKEEFFFPNIDMLVDAIVWTLDVFYYDGCSGYDQIKIDPTDAEKTSFWTLMGNFHFIVMPFGQNTQVPLTSAP